MTTSLRMRAVLAEAGRFARRAQVLTDRGMRSSATPKKGNHEKHPVEIVNDVRSRVRVRLLEAAIATLPSESLGRR